MIENIDISKLTDEELVAYSEEIAVFANKEIGTIQSEHHLPGGVTNSYGKGKEYLKADLNSYYREFQLIVKKYIIPIELEVKKRIVGNDEFYSELRGKIYNGLDLVRLEYFENNIKNAYVGRLSPRQTNPFWWTHLRKIKRFHEQPDYQEKLHRERRENNINDILKDAE